MPRFDIRIVEARQLPQKSGMKPCAFCIIENCGSKGQTLVAAESCNPIWDTPFKFAPNKVDDPVTITVFDDGGMCTCTPEQLSTIRIDLEKLGLVQGEVKEQWFEFPHQKGAAVRLRIVAHDFGFNPMMMMQQQQQQQYHQQQQQQPPQFYQPPPPQHNHEIMNNSYNGGGGHLPPQQQQPSPQFDPNNTYTQNQMSHNQSWGSGGAPPPPPPQGGGYDPNQYQQQQQQYGGGQSNYAYGQPPPPEGYGQ